jgi:toxin HigB-1
LSIAGFLEAMHEAQVPLEQACNVIRYSLVIVSFKSKETRRLFETEQSRRFSGIARIAVRKLTQLDAVERLEDLNYPPGNRLEALRGDRKGQHSIRINDQFRICFRWMEDGAHDVEIVDYH